MPAEAHIHDFDDFDDEMLDEALDREFDEDPDADDAPEDDHTSGRYDRSPHAGPWSLPDITLEQLCEALTTTDPRSLAEQLGWPLADLLDIISRADFAEVASRHNETFRAVATLRATAALPDAIEALRAVCAESDDPRQRRLAATALLRFLTARPPRSESPTPRPPARKESPPPAAPPAHEPSGPALETALEDAALPDIAAPAPPADPQPAPAPHLHAQSPQPGDVLPDCESAEPAREPTDGAPDPSDAPGADLPPDANLAAVASEVLSSPAHATTPRAPPGSAAAQTPGALVPVSR